MRALVARDLGDAKVDGLSPDRRFATAYNAALDGQPAPALKFGQPRVTAVLHALCHFLWTADGLTNAQLRPLVASLLGTSYTTRQMGYDLRRLRRKGLVTRLD